jgi:ectoine hydroxylase-related dioxygenase (phytanoyl-CoA dioxygenase family)
MNEDVTYEQDVDGFARDGYTLLRRLAEPERLASVQAAIARLLEIRSGRTIIEPGSTLPSRELDRTLLELNAQDAAHKSFIYDTLPNLPEVVGLATSPRVLGAVRRCLGLKPEALVAFINVNLRIDLAGAVWEHALPWHQDYPYRNKLYARGASAVLWMPVFDCPAALGPVEIKPGSQRSGEISTQEIPREIGASHWTIPDSRLLEMPYETTRHAMVAGDALIFDILLVHRSGVNRDPNRVRWTLQARFSSVEAPTFLEQHRARRPGRTSE